MVICYDSNRKLIHSILTISFAMTGNRKLIHSILTISMAFIFVVEIFFCAYLLDLYFDVLVFPFYFRILLEFLNEGIMSFISAVNF